MHERLLVGARAILNRDRCVHARNRSAARRIGARFSGVPEHGVCGGPGDQTCRRIEWRSSDPQRRRAPVTVAPKPSDANAAVFELVTVRLVPLPPCSVIAPPLMLEGFVVPVIESIFVSNV